AKNRVNECYGDFSPKICRPLAIEPKRAALLNRRPTVVWFKSDSRAMRSLEWLSSSMATISKGAANEVAPPLCFLQITDAPRLLRSLALGSLFKGNRCAAG